MTTFGSFNKNTVISDVLKTEVDDMISLNNSYSIFNFDTWHFRAILPGDIISWPTSNPAVAISNEFTFDPLNLATRVENNAISSGSIENESGKDNSIFSNIENMYLSALTLFPYLHNNVNPTPQGNNINLVASTISKEDAITAFELGDDLLTALYNKLVASEYCLGTTNSLSAPMCVASAIDNPLNFTFNKLILLNLAIHFLVFNGTTLFDRNLSVRLVADRDTRIDETYNAVAAEYPFMSPMIPFTANNITGHYIPLAKFHIVDSQLGGQIKTLQNDIDKLKNTVDSLQSNMQTILPLMIFLNNVLILNNKLGTTVLNDSAYSS